MNTMRPLGFVLLYAGFFGAAFFSVQHADSANLEWATVEWPYYSGTFLIGIVGVVLLRKTAKAAGTQTKKVDANLNTLHERIDRINESLTKIQSERDALGVYGIDDVIDERLAPDLGEFADAREAMIHRYSLQDYAMVMDRFAGGERMINRAWSASADGYIDEVWICLDRAQALMKEAKKRLDSLASTTAAQSP